MGWRKREGQSSTLEKILGAAEMVASGALLAFTFSPWGDRYLGPMAKPYAGLAAAALLAHGKYYYHHVAYEQEHPHDAPVSDMYEKVKRHTPTIRKIMDYFVPRAESWYASRKARYA